MMTKDFAAEIYATEGFLKKKNAGMKIGYVFTVKWSTLQPATDIPPEAVPLID